LSEVKMIPKIGLLHTTGKKECNVKSIGTHQICRIH
jgi:hypothetical protein